MSYKDDVLDAINNIECEYTDEIRELNRRIENLESDIEDKDSQIDSLKEDVLAYQEIARQLEEEVKMRQILYQIN